MSTSESGASAGGLTRRAAARDTPNWCSETMPRDSEPATPSLPQISLELGNENRGVLNLARVSSGIHRTISKAKNPLQGC